MAVEGSAKTDIEDDLESLKQNFPEESSNEEVASKMKELELLLQHWGKDGKKEDRGNKHVKLLQDIVENILLKNIDMKKDGKKIPITIENNLYKPQIDLHFIYKNKIHIFLEYKRWMKDTNSIRSAILNSLLIKEYGKVSGYENCRFYLIGGGKFSYDELSDKEDVLKPLLCFAKEKEYIKAYSIRKLKKLIEDIKNT